MQTDLTRPPGIEAPIVHGSFGPRTSVTLSAAGSDTGGPGSIRSSRPCAPPRPRSPTATRRRSSRPPRRLRCASRSPTPCSRRPRTRTRTRPHRPRQAEPPADGPAVWRGIVAELRAGRGHQFVPFGGQTAGQIARVLPVREIVETMVRDAAERLAAVSRATAGVTSGA